MYKTFVSIGGRVDMVLDDLQSAVSGFRWYQDGCRSGSVSCV